MEEMGENGREVGLDLFESVKQQRIVVFMVDTQRYRLAGKQLGQLALAELRTVSARILDEIPDEKDRKATLVLVDEASDLISGGDHFTGFQNRARESGLALIIAHQAIEQLQPAHIQDEVMSCCSWAFILRNGNGQSVSRVCENVGTKAAQEITWRVTRSPLLGWIRRDLTGSCRSVEQFKIHPSEVKSAPNLKFFFASVVGHGSAWARPVRFPRLGIKCVAHLINGGRKASEKEEPARLTPSLQSTLDAAPATAGDAQESVAEWIDKRGGNGAA